MATIQNIATNVGGSAGPDVVPNTAPVLGVPSESVQLSLPATGGAVQTFYPKFTSGMMALHVVGGDTGLVHYKATGTAAATLLTLSTAAADVVLGTAAINTGTATANKVHVSVLNTGAVQVYNAHTGAKTVRLAFM